MLVRALAPLVLGCTLVSCTQEPSRPDREVPIPLFEPTEISVQEGVEYTLVWRSPLGRDGLIADQVDIPVEDYDGVEVPVDVDEGPALYDYGGNAYTPLARWRAEQTPVPKRSWSSVVSTSHPPRASSFSRWGMTLAAPVVPPVQRVQGEDRPRLHAVSVDCHRVSA